LNQVALSRTSPARRRRGKSGQFGRDASHQFRLQLWKLAVKHLRHRMLNDLLNLLAVRHSQETIPVTSFSEDDATRKDTVLIADYTVLVL
jgi:hypothetical protein